MPQIRLSTTTTMRLISIFLFGFFVIRLGWFFQVSSDAVSDAFGNPSWSEVFSVRAAPRRVVRRKAPQFMLDLYAAVSDSGGTVVNSARLQRNVVRSFTGLSDGVFHFFNLTSFLRHYEHLVKAEFRWFRRPQPLLLGRHFYKVDLYKVLDSRVDPWRGNLIASRLLPMYTSGWEVFNVTSTMTEWIFNSDMNNGILVVSTLPSEHWIETAMQMGREAAIEESDVYLVIYSEDGHANSGKNTELPLEFLEVRDPLQTPLSRRKRHESQHEDDNHAVPCQRTPLYVDFAKIGWSGWIISPKGYHAYYCTGSCPFPLSGNLRATNHAIVQSIVNMLKLSNNVDRPCCVADVLHPISLLYFDDEENVVLKQYNDMVAGSCGCH